MGLNLGVPNLRDMTSDQFQALRRERNDAMDAVGRENIARLRAPVSFVGCDPKTRIHLMAVQHGARGKTISVSTDGNPSNAKWVPMLSKFDRPVCRIHHSQIEWTENNLGFLILVVPGWLASDREFAQARSPQLNAAIEWPDEHRAAWGAMRRFWNAATSRTHNPTPARRQLLTRDEVA